MCHATTLQVRQGPERKRKLENNFSETKGTQGTIRKLRGQTATLVSLLLRHFDKVTKTSKRIHFLPRARNSTSPKKKTVVLGSEPSTNTRYVGNKSGGGRGLGG